MSKKDDRRTSILKPFEENVPEVNKTKRRVSFHTHRTVKEFNKADMGGDQTPKNESIHYSGSSEEKSSFFGGNRPGSALTYTSHQTTDIVMNDKDFTMNSTANVTMAMFDRVAKRESRAIDDDATNVVDPTIAVFGNLIPFSTPIRNTTNYQEDQTLAFIEKFVPTERLTPEVRASPKRIAELYEEITCPIHISSPTSDKNPYNVDEDVAKAFKSCQLSPVKHRQEAGGGSLEFDLENDDHYAAEELLDGNKTLTMPQRSSSSPTSHALPMNSTYVVTASSVEGMYLPDESETINPISDPSKDKTYVVDQMKDDDIEMNDTSRTSSTTNSFHAPQHSEITKKKFRRLSDIINREKRRSSILSAAASSAANSPAIPEETAQQPSTLTVVNATINLSIAKSTINKSVANCSLDVFDEPMETTEAVSSEENVDDSLNQHDSVFENTFEQKPKQRNNTSILKNGTMLLEDVRTPTKYLEDSNFTIPVPPCDESFPTVHQPNDSEKLQKSDSNKSVISQKSVLNQTFEVQSEVSKIMPNGLPAIDKRYIRKEEAPKVNQTPGWAKYSKCLEIMKKMSEKEKKEQAIAMEDFDEEPNYLHGDSYIP
uniref:Uncharacterized protein n=1 Tax=Panagrolaimus superbus TaxID=310955 RepID=A0A914XT28_9BILA